MKTLSHKQISIYIASLGAIVAGIGILASFFTDPFHNWALAVSLSLLVFIVLYIFSYYLIRNFIIQKISPVYKVINTAKQTALDKIKDELNDNINIIDNVSADVEKWASIQVKEIENLRRLEKYRKEYIGDVSHELKTPIFSIQGYILTLLDGGIDDPEVNIKYLQRADKAINRMISIVRDLDEISRLESGELMIRPQSFDIIALFREIFESNEFLAKQRNIKLVIGDSFEKQIPVFADKALIVRLVVNLVVNSIKYGKPNGCTTVSFYDMESNIVVEVADNGIGMAEKDLLRIFERFYRVDKSRSREQGGTGLGLSIVKHIVEAHNQTINVKSKLNVGTSFSFTLQKGKL